MCCAGLRAVELELLHTASESLDRRKADLTWIQLTEAWEARLVGHSSEAAVRYGAAQEFVRVKGFRYLDVGTVARLPVSEIVERGAC